MSQIREIGEIKAALATSGLLPRGGFHPGTGDGVPTLAGGRLAATVLMVGNAGPAMWRAFSASLPDQEGAAGADPLDRWTKGVVDQAGLALGFEALYPFGGPPYWPVQRWALRTGRVAASPTGLLIDPEYGLWHAYRAALLFEARLELALPEPPRSPCDTCAARPCLSTCPVSAFTPGNYDAASCAAHVSGPVGGDCLGRGCLARHACPVGQAYAPEPAQAEFHMTAFLNP